MTPMLQEETQTRRVPEPAQLGQLRKGVPVGATAESAVRTAPSPAGTALTGLAFFDFDHTIISGDAGPIFGRHLFQTQRKALSSRTYRRSRTLLLWGRYAPFILWMGVQGALYKLHFRKRSNVVRSAYRGLRGVPIAAFQAEVDDFVAARIVERIYPDMVRVIREHHDAGRRCIILTTGMEPLVRRVLPFLPPGVELIGCRLLHKDGKLSGRVEGPLFGVDKANMLTAYALAVRIPLADCWAYSDHWSDVAMLEAVGHAVAVNPRRRLLRHAMKRGWQVLTPRLAKPLG